MKTKLSFIAILLLIAMLLGSCTNTPDLPENTEPPTSDNSTDTSTETPEDPFASLRSSGEEWITYGLAAYENGKKPKNLKSFFATSSNLTYLTLFDHFFIYDKEKTVPVAEALFSFIVDQYGIEALLDMKKRIHYKNEFLKSLGLEVQYTQTPEVELLLSSMDFSSTEKYPYIISFDKITYYFEDFSIGSPAQYHGFLYFNTSGLYEMIKYLTDNGLNDELDTDREFNFYMVFDGSTYSQTKYPSGDMYISDHSSALHEAVHALGIRKDEHIWLSEGICNYFGKALGFNDQIAASYIQFLMLTKQGYFDESANAGDQVAIVLKKIYEDYSGRGGQLDSVNTFDFRLYFDVSAKIELETGSYTTLNFSYKAINGEECAAVGADISYDQATSLICYLVDIYGIQKVLEAYHTQDIVKIFGKGYEELKSDWLAYLYN